MLSRPSWSVVTKLSFRCASTASTVPVDSMSSAWSSRKVIFEPTRQSDSMTRPCQNRLVNSGLSSTSQTSAGLAAMCVTYTKVPVLGSVILGSESGSLPARVSRNATRPQLFLSTR
jgi:hypothetical protein